MDAMERGNTSLKTASMYWNILLISLLKHFNGTTKSMKVAPQLGGWGALCFKRINNLLILNGHESHITVKAFEQPTELRLD
jgi:hypothetical protein